MLDPFHHLAGYEEILDHITCYFTDQDVYKAAQVCQEWKSFIENATGLWRRLFAAQDWTLVDGMDPFILYRQHSQMTYDLDRLVEGINSIVAGKDH